jgi:A/G-specific adenine glycosylase
MLQQTQVDRVIPKYTLFIKTFPDFKSLSSATEKQVLALWSGLGYNRRALYLHQTAQIIYEQYDGIIPTDPHILKTLPGIGDYMAHVLPTFIYNAKHTLIETNIRTVYLYHFFQNITEVSDTEITALITHTLPTRKTGGVYRDWYYALMDYGSYLKKELKIKNTQSKTYTKQKPFKGSLRFVRGTLLKMLLEKKILKSAIYSHFPDYTKEQIDLVCENLIKEKIIKETAKYYLL